MPRLRAPGVYYEPADPPPRRVAEVRTDIAGFVGVAVRGPLHVPVRVESLTQFETRFGGPTPDGFLHPAVRGFFANGGRTCWVVRAGVPTEARASAVLADAAGEPAFRVLARDPGPGAERLAVRVEPAAGGRFTLVVEEDSKPVEVWRDLDPVTDQPPGVRPTNRHPAAVVNGRRMSNSEHGQPDEAEWTELGSVLIDVDDLRWLPRGTEPVAVRPVGVLPRPVRRMAVTSPAAGVRREEWGALEVGPAGRTGRLGNERPAGPALAGLTLDHFTGENQPPDVVWGLKALERVDEVSVVAVPDLMWPGAELRTGQPGRRPRCGSVPLGSAPLPPAVSVPDDRPPLSDADRAEGQQAVLRHCTRMWDRFAVLDAPAGLEPEVAAGWAGRLHSDAGQFGGLYYPWLLVDAPTADDRGAVAAMPPSGHVAGMFARVDRTAGVHKPPANEPLAEVRGVDRAVSPDDHAFLTDRGVNAVRAFPGRGVRVAGGRTLVRPDDPDLRGWRYVHARRLVLMFEEAISRSAQWTVFEPNRPALWGEIDRVVRTFLDDQWRRGRLDGATADDAFQVTCDATSNPAAEAAGGRATCVIAVRPPAPAELVLVRLGRRFGAGGDSGA